MATDREKSLTIRSAVSAQYRHVTDGQTEILPTAESALCIASRGKNYLKPVRFRF